MNLFTYGTLMFPEVWRRVVGRECSTVGGTLSGFAVFKVQGGTYPVMIHAAQHEIVRGVIYLDIDADSMLSLDEYESDLYDRISVRPAAADGRRLECQAYVLPPGRAKFATRESWEAARFEREALADYLARLNEE
jgi:gamma-glutamylcyclotransferase (GGCT)/AIG2-like uncharacterized protein YtfP